MLWCSPGGGTIPGVSASEGLILAVSFVALAGAILALVRSPSETVRRMAQDAFNTAMTSQTTVEKAIVDVKATQDAVEEILDRAVKDRQRARSERQRAEEIRGNNLGPKTREETMVDLRRQAGLI